MGKFNPNQDNVYELISGELAGPEFAKPSYPTLMALSITTPWEMRSRPFRSQMPGSLLHPHRKAQTCFRIQERRQAFPPTALLTALCGRLKTVVQRCFTLTMPRILRPSSITPAKPLTAATNSLATNSSRLLSRMEGSILVRPTAWPCSACGLSDIRIRPELAQCPSGTKLKSMATWFRDS